MKRPVIALIVLFWVFVFGCVVGKTADTSTHSVRVIKVKERVVQKEVVNKSYVPASCLEVKKLADDVLAATSTYEAVLGREDQVQDDSYQAMNQRDQELLNKAEAEHRSIKDDTLDAVLKMNEATRRLKTVNQQCRDAITK